MSGHFQRIVRERRQYNQWVASQTLEDYALRYTAGRARRSLFQVGNTALGPIAFLACEAIGGSITLAYGAPNALWAIAIFTALMFLIGLPIAYYAARYGVDVDLLTRGAGFGYLGSTITSLIYASFTFLLFAIEASIMSAALAMLFHIPLAIGHLISALAVIPIALYGISLISRMQILTQPVWLVLQLLPVLYIATTQHADVLAWHSYPGKLGASDGSVSWLLLGSALSVLISLLPQIGEQVDYLRFLPERSRANRIGWWTALLATGPGWVITGGLKLAAGSLLAVFALRHAVPLSLADQPTNMYHTAFATALESPQLALALTGLFVVVCQLKINVTNAYAGSIAWSNFFSRLTHSHPGRVVWLVFNVMLALVLMEVGVLGAIQGILVIYANFAAGWLGAVTADLVVNKPLGLSPPHIEFKRAHLYDINPVGVGALLLAVLGSSLAFFGLFGPVARALSPIISLALAFIAAPLIAWATGGRYYLARKAEPDASTPASATCSVCENQFERQDMAYCTAYSAPICSLCCTLETRCHDHCKVNSRAAEQVTVVLRRLLPGRLAGLVHSRGGQFLALLLAFGLAIGFVLVLIYQHSSGAAPPERALVRDTLWPVFLSLMVVSGVAAWLVVLAHESRRAAEAESGRQTSMLMEEIDAHQRTDAALQKAKEVAEAANVAKTRYLVGISHEIRTPLNSIFGYAQLLERGQLASASNAVRIIRRGAEHLVSLVDGLLDISKIESGLLRLSRERVPLPEFLDQIVDMFRLQAAARGLEFDHQRPPKLPGHVYADQKRLRQVLINLLSNAIKYTAAGRVSFNVRFRSQVAEFEITDTGFGIASGDLERIFEPFERGASASVRAIPGTGLGLTITRLLTQLMGGDLHVRSTPGEGSCFTLRLMLSEAAPASGAQIVARSVTGYIGPVRRILVIDDDPLHCELVSELLEPLGFEVHAARDAASALAQVPALAPDLILLDLSLPDLSGWELAARLRELPGMVGVPILVVSANAHDYGSLGSGLHEGFLAKPIDLQVLLGHIGELLQLGWRLDGAERSGERAAALPGVEQPRPRAHLDALYQLGRIGHVRGIEDRLRQLELEDPASQALVAQLRALVANFDLRRYMSVIEAVRSHE